MQDVIVETLLPADLDEWINHCGSIFEVGPAYFRRHFVADPDKCYESIFVIKNGGAIVSTVRVFCRHIYIGGKIYKMGGIGEVSTNPDFRERGYSYAILKAAGDYMRENKYTISMLGTGRFSHYAKHGFVQVNTYTKSVEANRFASSNSDIRRLNADNFDDMSILYNKYAARNCSLVRSVEYWKNWCAGEIKNPHGLFKNGKLCGYICYDGSVVTEIAASEEDCGVLLSVVPHEENKINIPSFINVKNKVIEEHTNSSMMINIFSPVEINGVNYKSSAELAEYLNSNGGITLWAQDHF